MYTKTTKKRRLNEDEDDDDSNEEKVMVSRINNKIYFYNDVTKKSVFELMKYLHEATDFVKSKSSEIGTCGVIYLHINSNGGCLYSGLAAMDALRSNDVKVTTIMEGAVCSAATFIALGGTKVIVRQHCEVLIHSIHTEFYGFYEALKDEKDTMDNLMKKIRHIYETKASIPKKVLDKMFTRDIYINASQCIQWKLADEVL